jgi:hypothetical protein
MNNLSKKQKFRLEVALAMRSFGISVKVLIA